MKRILTICILSIIGLVDSLLLSILHMTSSNLCTSGCQAVLHSKWSVIFGIPIAVLGLGFYASTFYLGIRLRQQDKSAWPILTILVFLGFLMSVALFAIQAFDIGAFCPYCLVSFATVMVMFVLIFSYHHIQEGADLLEFLPSFQNHAVPVLISFFLPIFLVMGLSISRSESPVAAIIGEKKYRLDVIDSGLGLTKIKHDEALNSLREEWLDKQLLLEEAKKENLTYAALYEREITAKAKISKDEITHFFTLNAHVFPAGLTPDAEMRIEKYLSAQATQKHYTEYLKDLRKKYNVVLSLPKPVPLEIPKSEKPSPIYGAVDAKQTVVVFSDFECPFCRQLHLDINEAIKRNPGVFKVEYRFYPLSIHKYAKQAAIAAYCADKQGQFVAYAGLLYDHQKSLETENLKKYAEEISLDMPKFTQCLDDPESLSFIDSEIKSAETLGIMGTPTLFLNGYPLKTLPQ